MFFHLLEWHGHQHQGNHGRCGYQQGGHAKHAKVGIRLVKRNIDQRQGGETHDVGNNGQRCRHNRVLDGNNACLLVIVGFGSFLQKSSGDLNRVTNTDRQQQHRRQDHHGGQLELRDTH